MTNEALITQLRLEFARHDQIAADQSRHRAERSYHQGARDGIMLALLGLGFTAEA